MKNFAKSFSSFIKESKELDSHQDNWKQGDILDHNSMSYPLGIDKGLANSLGMDADSDRFIEAYANNEDKLFELHDLVVNTIKNESPWTEDDEAGENEYDCVDDLFVAQIKLSPDLTTFDILEVWCVDNVTYPDERAILGKRRKEGFEPIRNIPLPDWFGELVSEFAN